MTRHTLRAPLLGALVPSLMFTLLAPNAAWAEEPAKYDIDQLDLTVPQHTGLVTASELQGLCDTLKKSPDQICLGNANERRTEVLDHLGATCGLFSGALTASANQTLHLATRAELKDLASGECPAPRAPDGEGLSGSAERAGGGGEAGGSFTSDLLWATTGVIVDRAFETVNLWAADRALRRMCGGVESVDPPAGALWMKGLTPQVCSLVAADLGATDLSGMGQRLKVAATQDAITFPRHLATELLRLGWHDESDTAVRGVNKDMLRSTALVAAMMELIVEGNHPIDALAAWARGGGTQASDDALGDAASPMFNGLYQTSLFIASLDPGEIQLTKEGIMKLGQHVDDKQHEALALALLYNASGARLPDGSPLKKLTDGVVPKRIGAETSLADAQPLLSLHRVAKGLLEAGQSVQVAWMVSKASESGLPIAGGYETRPTPEQAWRAVASATSSLLSAAADALELAIPIDSDSQKNETTKENERAALIKKIREPLTRLGALLGSVGDSDRAGVVLKGLEMGLDLVHDAAQRLAESIAKKKAANEDACDLENKLTNLKKVAQEAGDSATLVGGLYTAESVEELEEALSAYVAPPGTYIEKRLGPKPHYLALNAYAGLGFGAEYTRGANTESFTKDDIAWAYWPVVSLGPEFGWRVCDECRNPNNLGLYVPLLDLGTLAQHRVEFGEQTTYTEVALVDVFAPGLYLTTGVSWWNTPFALQVGASVAPSLREVTEDGDKVSRSAVRAGANLVVDVPLRR